MTGDDPLFTPIELGEIRCVNRVVMAPMTRSRASPGDLVSDLHVEYYGARAHAGLIVTEATNISQQGRGYAITPGIYTDARVAAWQRVTEQWDDAARHDVLVGLVALLAACSGAASSPVNPGASGSPGTLAPSASSEPAAHSCPHIGQTSSAPIS